MNKVLSVWKPKNISSYDIIRKIKSINKSYKIGHCGTLDPFAEGIVVICIGNYTKKINVYMDCDKTYIATIQLGYETDTLDHTGKVIKISSNKTTLNEKYIISVIKKYNGNILQIPPYFSAKKIDGIKMYNFARKDIFIRPKPFKIKINHIDLIKYSKNSITLKINCEKGTYIRALARDISYDLRTYGYLSKLQRIPIGKFNKTNSLSIRELESCISMN